MSELYYEPYNSQSFVVRGGDKDKYNDYFKRINSRWNPRLTQGEPGWIVSRKCENILKELLKQIKTDEEADLIKTPPPKGEKRPRGRPKKDEIQNMINHAKPKTEQNNYHRADSAEKDSASELEEPSKEERVEKKVASSRLTEPSSRPSESHKREEASERTKQKEVSKPVQKDEKVTKKESKPAPPAKAKEPSVKESSESEVEQSDVSISSSDESDEEPLSPETAKREREYIASLSSKSEFPKSGKQTKLIPEKRRETSSGRHSSPTPVKKTKQRKQSVSEVESFHSSESEDHSSERSADELNESPLSTPVKKNKRNHSSNSSREKRKKRENDRKERDRKEKKDKEERDRKERKEKKEKEERRDKREKRSAERRRSRTPNRRDEGASARRDEGASNRHDSRKKKHSSHSSANSDKAKYYKTFAKPPSKFKALYDHSESDRSFPSSTPQSSSSAGLPEPTTPKRKKLSIDDQDYKQLFSKVRNIQKQIEALKKKR